MIGFGDNICFCAMWLHCGKILKLMLILYFLINMWNLELFKVLVHNQVWIEHMSNLMSSLFFRSNSLRRSDLLSWTNAPFTWWFWIITCLAFFVWTMAQHKILTMEGLNKRHLIVKDWCSMCKKGLETINNLLLILMRLGFCGRLFFITTLKLSRWFRIVVELVLWGGKLGDNFLCA